MEAGAPTSRVAGDPRQRRRMSQLPILPETAFADFEVPLLDAVGDESKVGDRPFMRRAQSMRPQATRFMLAAQYVHVALTPNEQLHRLQPMSATERGLAKVLAHRFYARGVFFLVLSLFLATPWSSPKAAPSQQKQPRYESLGPKNIRGAVGAFAFALVVDVLLKAAVSDVPTFFNRGWNRIRLSGLLICVVNAWLLPKTVVSLTAAPALVVVAELPALRRSITSMAATIPTVAPVIAAFAGVVFFYAQVGVMLWKECYAEGWEHTRINSHCVAVVDDGFDVEIKNAFNDVGRASLTLFVLSTTENFPYIMFPALACDSKPDRNFSVPLAVVYFVSFIFVVVYVVVNCLLAAFYHAWKHEHDDRHEIEKLRRYHALIAAFHALVGDGTSYLSVDDWDKLAAIMLPKSTAAERAARYALLMPQARSRFAASPWGSFDGDARAASPLPPSPLDDDDVRSPLPLSPSRLAALSPKRMVAMSPCKAARSISPGLFPRLGPEPRSPLSPRTPYDSRKCVTLDDFVLRCDCALIADAAELRRLSEGNTTPPPAVSARADPPKAALRRWYALARQGPPKWVREACRGAVRRGRLTRPAYAFVFLYVVVEGSRACAGSVETRALLDLCNDGIAGAFVLEHVVRFLARPDSQKAWANWRWHERLDLSLVCGAVLARCVAAQLLGPVLTLTGRNDVRCVAGACVSARLLIMSKTTRSLVGAICTIYPVLAQFVAVFVLAIYVYAALAAQLCAGVLPGRKHWAYQADDDDDAAERAADDRRKRRIMDTRITFNSLVDAWQTLLQIAVTNNWQDIINAHVFSKAARESTTAPYRTLIAFFLASFYVLTVWFGTNVTAAVVIDALLKHYKVVRIERERFCDEQARRDADDEAADDESVDGGVFDGDGGVFDAPPSPPGARDEPETSGGDVEAAPQPPRQRSERDATASPLEIGAQAQAHAKAHSSSGSLDEQLNLTPRSHLLLSRMVRGTQAALEEHRRREAGEPAPERWELLRRVIARGASFSHLAQEQPQPDAPSPPPDYGTAFK